MTGSDKAFAFWAATMLDMAPVEQPGPGTAGLRAGINTFSRG